jgi:hypothetical protein
MCHRIVLIEHEEATMERVPLLMNTTQAAEFLGVGVALFRDWSRQEDFGARPVSRSGSSRKYWRRAELEKIGMSDSS